MGKIELVPANPRWPEFYRRAAGELRAAIGQGPWIEHIGSTAAGLAAKPVLDVLIGVAEFDAVEATASQLVHAGFKRGSAPSIPHSIFLEGRPDAELPPVNAHIAVRGESVWNALLQFRDRLRDDPQLAARYAALKAQLAIDAGADLDLYTEGKSSFIRDVLDPPK